MKTPLVILGIGKSGNAAHKLLLKMGFSENEIYTFDEKNATAQFQQWSDLEKLEIGTFVLSPGLPLAHPQLTELLKKGWALTSEINLACTFLTDEVVIGITGSVGKSTVTTLLGEAVKTIDPFAFVGGNLGTPFCEYAFKKSHLNQKAQYVILELSSYQLENCDSLNLDYSIMTYLSANHLERYSSADLYYKTKCAIGKKTKHVCLINQSSEDLMNYQNFIECSYEKINRNSFDQNLILQSQLIGQHNLDNVALALRMIQILKIDSVAQKALFNFKGLSHRLEVLGLYKNILFINDSKATAMDSVLVAVAAGLEKLSPNKYLHVFLGGRDKNLPWEQLQILSTNLNLKFIFFGECHLLAQNKSKLSGQSYPTLNTALTESFNDFQSGDIVLLSPGGTSLDEFKNFEDRGEFFRKKVVHPDT